EQLSAARAVWDVRVDFDSSRRHKRFLWCNRRAEFHQPGEYSANVGIATAAGAMGPSHPCLFSCSSSTCPRARARAGHLIAGCFGAGRFGPAGAMARLPLTAAVTRRCGGSSPEALAQLWITLSSTVPVGAAKKSESSLRTVTVDLRSDTVTRPTPAMRRAMAEAEMGDDVYGEDPTINRLEQRAAEIFGREAAIFVPSGSMGNTIAIKIHTRPGQEVICEERSHVFNFEMAMMAHFSGCLARPVRGENVILTWADVRRRIAGKIYYLAQTGLVSLENTHNMAGGTVYPPEIADEICDGAHDAGLPVHLDGARVFNAAVALGRS